MSESNPRRVPKLAQKVADDVLVENPPADKVYERDQLLERAGLKAEPGTRLEQRFFEAFNERLADKGGRIYVVAGPRQVTICSKEDSVRISEEHACHAAELRMSKHNHMVGLIEKHLDAQGQLNAARSVERVSKLAGKIRQSVAEAGIEWASNQNPRCQVKQVEVTIRGKSPLLMHNVRMANPLDEYAKKMGDLNRAKKVKGADKDEIAVAMARIEWQGGLYHGETDRPPDGLGPYVPARNIHQAIHEASKMTKEGAAIREGSFPLETRFRLDYDGPRTVEEMWADGRFFDQQMVVVGMSKVPRTRPIFATGWKVTIRFDVDPDACDPDSFVRYVKSAGLYKGICDGHKGIFGMGRFEVV